MLKSKTQKKRNPFMLECIPCSSDGQVDIEEKINDDRSVCSSTRKSNNKNINHKLNTMNVIYFRIGDVMLGLPLKWLEHFISLLLLYYYSGTEHENRAACSIICKHSIEFCLFIVQMEAKKHEFKSIRI